MYVLPGRRADHRDRTHPLGVDRQRAAVAQQHRAAFLGAVGHRGVRRAVVLGDFVGPSGVVEEPEGEQLPEDFEHPCFEGRLGHRSIGERKFDLRGGVAAVADVEVQARVQVRFGLVAGEEVGDHEAVEAPLAAQDAREQGRVRARVFFFEQVVRAHDRRAVRLHDRRFEGGELDLVQRARVDVHVHERTPAVGAEDRRHAHLTLLVVGREVLDVRHHPLRLQAVDPADRGLRGEERVLAVGLERTPAEGRAHDVHRRPEVAVEATVLDLLPDDRTVARGRRLIEVGGERHRGRHRRGAVRAGAEPAGAHRAVGELDRWHAHVARFAPGQDPDLVGLRHGAEQQLRASFRRKGGVAPGMASAAAFGARERCEQDRRARQQRARNRPERERAPAQPAEGERTRCTPARATSSRRRVRLARSHRQALVDRHEERLGRRVFGREFARARVIPAVEDSGPPDRVRPAHLL